MSNRKRATPAQRIWREVRKLSATEVMQGYPIRQNGEQIFFWRPDELDVEISDIRTSGRGRGIYANFLPRDRDRSGEAIETGTGSTVGKSPGL